MSITHTCLIGGAVEASTWEAPEAAPLTRQAASTAARPRSLVAMQLRDVIAATTSPR